VTAASSPDLSRTLRCPRCKREFSTARRFLVTCTGCGHAWQEASVLTRGERVGSAFGTALEFATMPLMWMGVVLGLALLFGPLLYIVVVYADASVELIVAVAVILLLLGFSGFTFGGTTAWDTWVKHRQTVRSRTNPNDDAP
jgi:hypothetical protein